MKTRAISLGEKASGQCNTLKAAFKTELIQADSPLLSHSSSTLIRRGNRSQFVKTQLALWADWNHFSTQQNATDKTDLFFFFKERQQAENSSVVYQSERTKGLSAKEWKYPPDVINRCIINPILFAWGPQTDFTPLWHSLTPGFLSEKNLEISFWAWCQMLAMKYS